MPRSTVSSPDRVPGFEVEGVRVIEVPPAGGASDNHPDDVDVDVDIDVTQVAARPPGSLADLGAAEWDGAWDAVESLAARYRRVVPGMKSRGWGRLIVVGESSAKALVPTASELDHVVGLAVLGLQKTLAGELGPFGITVNSVLLPPASGDGAQRAPEDVAALVVYLASVPAAFVNGVAIVCDRGALGSLL